MPLLRNAGLQAGAAAFGTKQPVPFGLDKRITVLLGCQVYRACSVGR